MATEIFDRQGMFNEAYVCRLQLAVTGGKRSNNPLIIDNTSKYNAVSQLAIINREQNTIMLYVRQTGGDILAISSFHEITIQYVEIVNS